MKYNAFAGNELWKAVFKDAGSLARDKHPKALHSECLSNNQYWRHYASQPEIDTSEIAMIVCKDLGCDLNYCGLIKKSLPMEWEGSSDCSQELKIFNTCMKRES